MIAYCIQFTCKDTDLDVHTGRGNRVAMVEFYIPTPKGMNGHGMTYAGAVLNDSRFETYSAHRALSGTQVTALNEGHMVKLTRPIKIQDLSPTQIKKRLREEWKSLHANIQRELVKRYEMAGVYETLDDLQCRVVEPLAADNSCWVTQAMEALR